MLPAASALTFQFAIKSQKSRKMVPDPKTFVALTGLKAS